MAKPGPKSKGANVHQLSGTYQPCRHEGGVIEFPTGWIEPERPKWLTGRARKIWESKVERYRARDMNVCGFEDSLAQYCAIEADLIDDYKRKLSPPVAKINAHRIWASEFGDTPASLNVKAGGKPSKGNPFAKHGRR